MGSSISLSGRTPSTESPACGTGYPHIWQTPSSKTLRSGNGVPGDREREGEGPGVFIEVRVKVGQVLTKMIE